MIQPATKQCRSCLDTFTLDRFSSNRGKKGRPGHSSICKPCDADRQRKRRATLPDDYRYRPGRKNNPDKALNSWLRNHYGITLAEYKALNEAQGGVCAICNGPELRWKRLCVDHCHASRKVRKLLCTRCNKVLGFARDDVEVLRRAIQYLEEHELDQQPLTQH